MKHRIALALIVKGTDQEAELLDRCLGNTSWAVDGIFVTSTYKDTPNAKIDEVCKKYGANISYFKWINDFAAARNFNFSQVTSEYDYILWCDADDVFRGLERLHDLVDENPTVDAFAFNYLYDFDKYKNPTVVHKKSQLIRNDGCVEWAGRLHEDFKENRAMNVQFVDFIERMHLTTEERIEVAKTRNVEISKLASEDNPNDPRVYFNLANSYFGAGMFKSAKDAFEKFIKTSASEEEKYVAYQRLGDVCHALGEREDAIRNLQISIGMSPMIPDSYHQLGYLYSTYNMLDKAEEYLLLGLQMKPRYHAMIVYNPRDYDYNPFMALANVYINKHRPDLALPMLKGCLAIYPEDEYHKGMVAELEKETARLAQVLDIVDELKDKEKDAVLARIDSLPKDLQSHPAICRLRNSFSVKTESSGKDIAYYCGETHHEWNPEMAKTKGIGGSEEAVINLSKQWAKMGYNVTVYNSCGVETMECDGVSYKPFWHYNPRDKQDITVIWRSPRLADHDINSTKVFVDLHDVIPKGEFNEKRLKKIDKIFVKTKFHRSLFPNVPDEKFAIIPNGQDFDLFDDSIEKDPMLLVNTSSPDRSLDVLPKLFKRIKEQVPEARLKWAYGWDIFDNSNASNKDMMAWKEKVVKEMEEAGIENLGRLSQKECAKMYMEGRILAYPSEFAEIDCISVKKAQACGCTPITTDFGAFAESNKHGITVKSPKDKDNWVRPYQFSFGIEDEKVQDAWVEAVVSELKKPINDEKEMKKWAKRFEWPKVAKEWVKEL